MQETKHIQVSFKGGVNPGAPAHLIADDEVQTATNIDFELINGALVPRRGCVLNTAISAAPISQIYNNYNQNSNPSNGFQYVVGSGTLYRRTITGSVPGAATAIGSSANTNYSFPPPINSYKQYVLWGGGNDGAGNTANYKDDGTAITEWIMQTPAKPVVSTNALSPLSLAGPGFTVPIGTPVSGVATATCIAVTEPTQGVVSFQIDFASPPKNLGTNGSSKIGNFGVFFIDLGFSDPSLVASLEWKISIGDATYYNYFDSSVVISSAGNVIVGSQTPQDVVDNALQLSSSPISLQQRQDIVSQFFDYNQNINAVGLNLTEAYSPWSNPVPAFIFYGTGTPDWTQAYSMQINVVCTDTCTVSCRNPQIYGAQDYCLTDTVNGYYYWQTFCTTNAAGAKVNEGPNSIVNGPVFMQNDQAVILSTTQPTGSIHGVNAVITYRQGGLMTAPYAVATTTWTTGTVTTTDKINDIQALANNFPLTLGIQPQSAFVTQLSAIIDQAYADRVFIGQNNIISWSLPGQIGSIPATSQQEVAPIGDNIQAILNWNPAIIIINNNSIYEMSGQAFETPGGYTLTKTGSKKGSGAARTCIRTPYGIPLLNPDSLTMWIPGYNVEQTIPWFDLKYSDMFKGNQNTDPAVWKGSRIPALNSSVLFNAVASYQNNKLYIAAATGNSTFPNTLFVINFTLKQCYWHTYSFNITSLLADPRSILFWAGTSDGKVMNIEFGTLDYTTAGVPTATVWTARTKVWTTDAISVTEDISIDAVGTNIQVKAYYDDSTNPVVTTLTKTVRNWFSPPLNGTFVNSVAFDFTGTNSQLTTAGTLVSVYEFNFDYLTEPGVAQYFRTDYDTKNYELDKLWDVARFDLEIIGTTNTISAVTFVDSTAVMTNTLVGRTGTQTSGRYIYEAAFPAEIYGRVAYTTYTGTGQYLKHWETSYDARNEPAKINYYRTDIESLEENIVDAFDVDINPNGTVFGTCYVDNVAILTATISGTNRQSFTFDTPQSTYPVNLYGRTLYVAYTGTAFKHYQTWFHKRLEPDRWSEFVSPKVSGDEREIKVFKPEVNCLGNVVLATTWLEGTAISTHTITGTKREQYTFSLPVEQYARTVFASYKVLPVNGTSTGTYAGPGTGPTIGRFKHYSTEFEGPVEPPRVTIWRTGPYPFVSDHWLKTWSPELDPISGTVTGTLIVEDVVLTTQTFTGNRRQWFTVGLDLELLNNYALQTGSRWEAVYTAATQFKHYDSKLESDTAPFTKAVWSFHYKKIGGATQLDMGRFWSAFLDIPTGVGTMLGTYWWDIDSQNFTQGTITLLEGMTWTDRIAFPPGARGRLFEFRFNCANSVAVHNINIDLAQEGIKGLTRRGKAGDPQDPNF